MTPFGDLVGKTLTAVNVRRDHESEDDCITFRTSDGHVYEMTHLQDCCEHVTIEDICGDLSALVGHPVLMAEAVSSSEGAPREPYDESYTWTFYNISTVRESVTIRWYGTSNGYYSEDVWFYQVTEGGA